MSHSQKLDDLFSRLQVSIFEALKDVTRVPEVDADWKMASVHFSRLGDGMGESSSQAFSTLAHSHMNITQMALKLNVFRDGLMESLAQGRYPAPPCELIMSLPSLRSSGQCIMQEAQENTRRLNEIPDVSSVLRNWILLNLHHPFPNFSEKALLRSKTGISEATLKTYFTNLRRRCGWNSNLAILAGGKKEVFAELVKRVMKGDVTVDAREKGSIQKMVDYVQGKFEYNNVGDWLKKVIDEPLPARALPSSPYESHIAKKARTSSFGGFKSSPSPSHPWESESVSTFSNPPLFSSPIIPLAETSPDWSALGENTRRRKLPQMRIPSFPTSLRSVSSSSVQSSLSNISFALDPTLEESLQLIHPRLCTTDVAAGSAILSNNAWESTIDPALQGFQEGGFRFGASNSMNLTYNFNPSLQNLHELPSMPDFPVYIDSMNEQPFFFTSPSFLLVTTNEFDFGFDLLHPSTSTRNSTLAVTTNPPEAPGISTSTLPLYLSQPSVLVESPIEITPSSESTSELTPDSIIRNAKSLPPTRTKRKQVIYYSDPSVYSSLYPRAAIATSNLGLGEEKHAGQWEDVDVSRKGEAKKAKMSKSTAKTTPTPKGKNGKK